MKNKTLSFFAGSLLAFLATLHLQGQSAAPFSGSRHLVELSAGLLRAAGPEVASQSLPVAGASVDAKAFTGGAASLRYHYRFLSRWSAQLGFGAGYYPSYWRVNASPEWLGQERGFSNSRLYNSDGVFINGSLGAAYHLLSNEEHLLSLGGGLQVVYFPESQGSSSMGRGEVFSFPLEFSTISRYGDAAGTGLFPAAYLSLQYFRRVNSRLAFITALEGAYSKEKPGSFSYILNGDSATLQGSYRQRYFPMSLRVGLGYTFR